MLNKLSSEHKESFAMRFKLLLASILISVSAFSQDNTYEIYALEFANSGWKAYAHDIAVGATTEDSLFGHFVIWLLKGNNGKTVLVDAGFTDTTQFPQKTYMRPDIVLQKLNVKAEDITDIIVTHPHWDHIGGIHLFPNAMLWMQEEDYDYFVGKAWQFGGFTLGFNKEDVSHLTEKNLNGHLTLVKGDNIEVIPGIRVFIGSKHTYQSQYVLVNGTSGKTILASDNIWFYYNLEHLLPIPTFTFDPDAYVNAMKRMKTLVDDTRLIIPGHDMAVFKRFPKVTEGVVKIEIRD